LKENHRAGNEALLKIDFQVKNRESDYWALSEEKG